MTVTGKKKSGSKQKAESMDQFDLVYQNPKKNTVNPKRKTVMWTPKTPRPDPVSFVMEHENLFQTDDDTI